MISVPGLGDKHHAKTRRVGKFLGPIVAFQHLLDRAAPGEEIDGFIVRRPCTRDENRSRRTGEYQARGSAREELLTGVGPAAHVPRSPRHIGRVLKSVWAGAR